MNHEAVHTMREDWDGTIASARHVLELASANGAPDSADVKFLAQRVDIEWTVQLLDKDGRKG